MDKAEVKMALDLATKFIDEKNFAMAEEQIAKAERMDPGYVAESGFSINDYKADCLAEKAMAEALKYERKDAQGNTVCYQIQTSMRWLQQAMDLSPGLAKPYLYSSDLQMLAQNPKKAYPFNKALVALFPDNVEMRANYEHVKKMATAFQGSFKLLIGLGVVAILGLLLGGPIMSRISVFVVFGGAAVGYWFWKQGLHADQL